jgi:hypothetical protein
MYTVRSSVRAGVVFVTILQATVEGTPIVPPDTNIVAVVLPWNTSALSTPTAVNVTSEIIAAPMSVSQSDQSNVMSIVASGSFKPLGFLESVRFHHLLPVKTGAVDCTKIVLAALGVKLGATCVDVSVPATVLTEEIEDASKMEFTNPLADTVDTACNEACRLTPVERLLVTVDVAASAATNLIDVLSEAVAVDEAAMEQDNGADATLVTPLILTASKLTALNANIYNLLFSQKPS